MDVWKRYFALELYWHERLKGLTLKIDKCTESNWGGALEFTDLWHTQPCERGKLYSTGGERTPEATLENLLEGFQEDYPVSDEALQKALELNAAEMKVSENG